MPTVYFSVLGEMKYRYSSVVDDRDGRDCREEMGGGEVSALLSRPWCAERVSHVG